MDFNRRNRRARFYQLHTGFNVTVMEGFSKFMAEVIGTAFLMFGGCMGCVGFKGPAPDFAGAISFGLVVMTVILSYGHISGAHLNPAVTLSAVIFRLISIPVSNELIFFFSKKTFEENFFYSEIFPFFFSRIKSNTISRFYFSFFYRWRFYTFSHN